MPRPPRMIKAGGDLLMAGLAIPAAGARRSPLFPAARLAGLPGKGGVRRARCPFT